MRVRDRSKINKVLSNYIFIYLSIPLNALDILEIILKIERNWFFFFGYKKSISFKAKTIDSDKIFFYKFKVKVLLKLNKNKCVKQSKIDKSLSLFNKKKTKVYSKIYFNVAFTWEEKKNLQ